MPIRKDLFEIAHKFYVVFKEEIFEVNEETQKRKKLKPCGNLWFAETFRVALFNEVVVKE